MINTGTAADVKMTSQASEISIYANIIELKLFKKYYFFLPITFIPLNSSCVAPRETIYNASPPSRPLMSLRHNLHFCMNPTVHTRFNTLRHESFVTVHWYCAPSYYNAY